MSMAKPDIPREMFERQMEHFDKTQQDKIRRAIINESEKIQRKVEQLQRDVVHLEQKTRTLHENKSWIKLKFYSFILRRKKQKLDILKRITPTKKSTEQLLD
ncbi:MAG TPA: hypothetical protein VJB66_03340 [Candidatus Nanoarchaeia archaeon]|nr:hypothetical protein [Candidatus Nanoarchaeia archaeon]